MIRIQRHRIISLTSTFFQDQSRVWKYWWLCLIIFWHFFTIYVFEVRESISDIPTELPCSYDLKNPGQLPVWEVLWGTDDCVSWIFTISLVFKFSGSRNPLLTFLLSYRFRVTSKIQVNFRFERYSEVLMIVSYGFSQFLHYVSEVKESIADIPMEPRCMGDLQNL